MKYDGDVQVGGKLAGVGQRLLDTASKSMIRQGLEALNSALQARMAAKAGGSDISYKPPTENEFMTAVAKDVAGEMLTSSRTVWIIIAILIVLAIVVAILVSSGQGG
jgi:hypothetical protein